MKAFALFFLRKFFWDFYDNLFVILFFNFIYILPLVIFYALLQSFAHHLDLFLLLAAVFYGVLISPILMPLTGFLKKISRLEFPSLTEFWLLFREIPWKRCWLIHAVFLGTAVIYFFNVWFYLSQLSKFPFLIAVLIIFFFLGLILIAWYGMSLVFFVQNRFTFKRFRTLAGIVIEYWTFLLPWMMTWIVFGGLSYFTVLFLVIFFPSSFLLFMSTFIIMIEKNYGIKEDVISEVKTKTELIRRYKFALKEYYERHADEEGHYDRGFKDLIRPWRG